MLDLAVNVIEAEVLMSLCFSLKKRKKEQSGEEDYENH